MADNAVKTLSGKSNVKVAWDAIIRNFNLRKIGKATGYTANQTIFIKINNGQAGWAQHDRRQRTLSPPVLLLFGSV